MSAMDGQSWHSETSPGETEGSVSSHSDRFNDDQACSNNHSQSPEVMPAAPNEEEDNDRVKTLTEKLSAALFNISTKEDLVKQHAKVAEEAVSGWEKAENEASALKQQLEAAAQKNRTLEDRVGNLDGALKECVRQFRQVREDQEQKIHEAVAKKTVELEFTQSKLETQLVELHSQVQATKAELEIMVIERDLSTKAAEVASKQHLASIKKVAKLESEIQRLKSVAGKQARKQSVANDQRSVTASSVYVESYADSQSDDDSRKINGLEPNKIDSWASALIEELDEFKSDKAVGGNLMANSVEVNLMDDFLEMEKLAALPQMEDGSCPQETPLKAECEAMKIRIVEMEEKLEKMETEKVELELAFTECQDELQASRDRLVQAEVKLEKLQTCLAMANEARSAIDLELATANAKREPAELQLSVVEGEIKTLLSKVGCLEEEVRKEKALSEEAVAKCQKLEDDISRMKREVDIRNAAMLNGDLKIKQEKELAVAAANFAECQKTIFSIGQQLKSLATMDDGLIYSEKPLKEGVTIPC